MRWQFGGSLRVEVELYRVRLVYVLDGRRIEQRINLDDTPVHYGRRAWFGCPECGRRCAKLYLQGRFVCRQCAHLHYEAQSAAQRRRTMLRFWKVWSQLVDEYGEVRRPKWMRHARYRALLAAAERLESSIGWG